MPPHAPDETPLPPLCTLHTDRARNVVVVGGHLDRVGAEALVRTVAALGRLGHRRVVVRLGSATVADDARALLADPGDGTLVLP